MFLGDFGNIGFIGSNGDREGRPYNRIKQTSYKNLTVIPAL